MLLRNGLFGSQFCLTGICFSSRGFAPARAYLLMRSGACFLKFSPLSSLPLISRSLRYKIYFVERIRLQNDRDSGAERMCRLT